MKPQPRPSARARSAFWLAWLRALLWLTVALALLPLVAPQAAAWAMSLLVFADPAHIGRFVPQAGHYMAFLHGVVGALMLAWASLLLWLVRGPLAAGSADAWKAMATSLAAWFLPGTLFSAWLGIWPNVVVNLLFASAFAIPLAGLFRACRGRRD